MHSNLIKHATEQQLKEFLNEAFSVLKTKDVEMYDELELKLYKEIYGCHFNDWLLECATSKMVNEDGSLGAKWTLSQTNQVAKSLNIMFNNYNEYDYCYVINMIYSDYYGVMSNDAASYGKMAKAFLEDKDAPKGKALKYYLAMKG